MSTELTESEEDRRRQLFTAFALANLYLLSGDACRQHGQGVSRELDQGRESERAGRNGPKNLR
jgi:hypothetical protein